MWSRIVPQIPHNEKRAIGLDSDQNSQSCDTLAVWFRYLGLKDTLGIKGDHENIPQYVLAAILMLKEVFELNFIQFK